VAPVADFTADPLAGTAPLSVQFNDTSTGAGITSWAWDFNNDGTIDSSSQNPVFTYASAGTYSVRLTVTNAGGSDSELKTDYITVSEAPVAPVADFSADATTGIIPFTVHFTDLSTGTGITAWAWDFNGDGAIDSNSQNPVYTYDNPGRYTVNLTVTGAIGTDTEVKTNYIVANRYVEPFPGYTRIPTDPDFDGLYGDINGNGRLDFDDVVAFYMNMQWVRDNAAVGISPYDFNNNGRIDYDDVVQLYQEVLNG
jgi:PKD repeat protein